jgi:hypothetical protein
MEHLVGLVRMTIRLAALVCVMRSGGLTDGVPIRWTAQAPKTEKKTLCNRLAFFSFWCLIKRNKSK